MLDGPEVTSRYLFALSCALLAGLLLVCLRRQAAFENSVVDTSRYQSSLQSLAGLRMRLHREVAPLHGHKHRAQLT